MSLENLGEVVGQRNNGTTERGVPDVLGVLDVLNVLDNQPRHSEEGHP